MLVNANVAPIAKDQLVAVLAVWRAAHVTDAVVLERFQRLVITFLSFFFGDFLA